MPTLADIRAAHFALVNGISGIGQVHDYERYASRVADLKALYAYQGQIRGWHLRRIGTKESSPGRGRHVVDHAWQWRGYMSLDDSAATEETFDDLIEAIRDAYRADDSLSGLVATMIIGDQAGVQVQDSGPVLFGGVLCHSARLAVTTRHYQ